MGEGQRHTTALFCVIRCCTVAFVRNQSVIPFKCCVYFSRTLNVGELSMGVDIDKYVSTDDTFIDYRQLPLHDI
jgi:hypothetical protein